jgi:hypothetical protein
LNNGLLLLLSVWWTLSANLPQKCGLVGLDEAGLSPEEFPKVVFWHVPGDQALLVLSSILSNNNAGRVGLS